MAYTNNPQYTYSDLSVSTGTTNDYFVSDITTTWNPVAQMQNATLDLRGENADIKINDESLMATLRAIKEYLLIPPDVRRDPNLEEEFEALRVAGEHYESLLKHYKEQQKVWDTLKKDF